MAFARAELPPQNHGNTTTRQHRGNTTTPALTSKSLPHPDWGGGFVVFSWLKKLLREAPGILGGSGEARGGGNRVPLPSTHPANPLTLAPPTPQPTPSPPPPQPTPLGGSLTVGAKRYNWFEGVPVLRILLFSCRKLLQTAGSCCRQCVPLSPYR